MLGESARAHQMAFHHSHDIQFKHTNRLLRKGERFERKAQKKIKTDEYSKYAMV